ncbi:MAG: PAS-domain containing protein [Acetobacteraceae bacterium]|nr:PAS-domain containing protein [Acetobacteraceae bacterium]
MKRETARRLGPLMAIGLAVVCLVALTWVGTLGAIRANRKEVEARVSAAMAIQAQAFADQIAHYLADIDQTLRVLIRAWQTDRAGFDLQSWRKSAVAATDITQDIMLADGRGLVVQATAPQAVGSTVSDRDYFQYALAYGASGERVFATPARLGTQSHLHVARWIYNADRSLAEVIVAEYRISAIAEMFARARLRDQSILELVGASNGLPLVVAGSAGEPYTSISETPMIQALRINPNGSWSGKSAPDGPERLLVFRQVPGHDLGIVVGRNPSEALAPSHAWEFQAKIFAGCISGLIALMGGTLVIGSGTIRRRQQALAHERAVLSAANAELALAKARADAKAAQLEATLSGMSDGVAMMDAQLRLVEWNAHFPQIAGIPPEMLHIGLPMEDILRAQALGGQFGDVDVDAEVARRMAILRAGQTPGVVERRRPDGNTIELHRNWLPDGGFVTLYTDVTARKRAEDALREARAIAEAATEAKSRFVAIVSHEIRSPLNALLNTLHLLADGSLRPAQQALLHMARQSGDVLLGLVNDILDMSRMEAGQLTLRPSIFEPGPLLEATVEMFRVQALERGINIKLSQAASIPAEMYADPGRLQQILINFLSNAVKFGTAGEVVVTARRERTTDRSMHLRVSVRDRGPVIIEEDRARLFRPFSQLNQAGVREPLGSGLGLAICRQLATLMGGAIGCDAWDVGEARGNEFWFRVPLPPIPTGVRISARKSESIAGLLLPRTRILLAEDILANQVVTATLLRRQGHLVDVAFNGEEALLAASCQPYDLIFMDIFMPGIGGLEVARRMRGMSGPAAATPIIALTANVSPEDQLLFQAAGMNGVLAKPVSLTELLDVLACHVWKGVRADGASSASCESVAPAGIPVLSQERIEELRTNFPPGSLSRLVEECLVELRTRLVALRRAILSGAMADVASHSHAMVGMAAGYGMAALEARLRAMMRAGTDPAAISALADALDADVAQTEAALRQTFEIEMV